MTTSVRYPPSAARALGLLTSHNNDIEIYVEDTSTPNLWVKLLRKYLPPNIRLNDVNVLGSRVTVIQACKLDQQLDGRKKLYIIDGDLELLIGKHRPRLRHLYRLRGYCVENYLMHEDALVSAVTTINPKISENVARRQIDFLDWLERNRNCLEKLFVCYGVTYEMKSELKTIGFSVYRLLKGGGDFDFCERKVSIRILKLYRKVRAEFSRENTRKVYGRIQLNARAIGAKQFASGKDYIFPPIYQRIKSKNRTNITSDAFKVLIAQCMDGARDPYLLRRIRIVCG